MFGNHFLSWEYFIFNFHVPDTNGTAHYLAFLMLPWRHMTLISTEAHIYSSRRLFLKEEDTVYIKSVFWPASLWRYPAL